MHCFFTLIVSLLCLSSCQNSETEVTEKRTINTDAIRVAALIDPSSFDPRKIRDLSSSTYNSALYEGLMRIGLDGEITYGMAEKVALSDDQTRYRFTLRGAKWSNGEPVTAHDFVHSWQTALSPHFPSPNAYQLFVIKNAKAAKEGALAVSEVGVKALDDQTLLVELEAPTPYFLEMTAFPSFFPVNRFLDLSNPEWAGNKGEHVLANGPFKIKEYAFEDYLTIERNPHYYLSAEGKAQEVVFLHLDEKTALNMFSTGELDWVGSPLGSLPGDALPTLNKEGKLKHTLAAGTHIYRFNTTRFPFSHPKLRRAFSFAINRKVLTDHILQGNELPATALVPHINGWEAQNLFQDGNNQEARRLFAEGLSDLGMRLEDFPPVKLSYGNSERSHRIAQAIQQQWNEVLGVWIELEALESKTFFAKLKQLDYAIASGSWFADFRDPISFLEVFSSQNNGTNNTGWENAAYRSLLSQSSGESPIKRKILLQYAEEVLAEEMPVAPLFYYNFHYCLNPRLENIGVNACGIMNFRESTTTTQ